MRYGRVYRFGDVILATVQYTDTFEIKTRPALVLFEDHGNIVVVGITSNTRMEGIPVTKKEGAIVDSVIKTNYIFTISDRMVKRHLFSLTDDKKKIIKENLIKRLNI